MIPKALIAEDEPTSRILIEKALLAQDMMVVRASDGNVAWQILQDNKDFSLLVTDISMPNMDGYELIRRVRNDPSLAELTIFVVSGVVLPNQINDILKSGVARVIPKPVEGRQLRDYVQRTLNSA